MIQERKGSQPNEDDSDLFSSLLAANDDENLWKGKAKLTDSELIGKPQFKRLDRTVATFFNRQCLHIDGRRT